MDEGFGISAEMLVKAAAYAAWIGAAGACAVRWLIVPRTSRHSSGDAAGLARSAASVLLASSTIALLATFLRAWTHTAAAFGYAESFAWDNLRVIALESRWGQGWSWQAMAAVALLTCAVAAGTARRWAWGAATLAVTAFGLSLPLVGHAAGSPARVFLHATHLAGAGLWVGSLFVLSVDLIRRRQGTATFQLFAPVALTGSAVIVLSGLIAAALYVGSPASLFGTAYGRTLLVKVGLFAGAAAYGWINWRRMQQASEGTRVVTHAEMSATTRRELALAAAVIVATGVLTELPNP